MDKYIGFKMIEAEPMTVQEYNKQVNPLVYSGECQEGYLVKYEGGYASWSPKEVFEKAYMKVGNNNTITQELVDNFIIDYDIFTKKNKITIVIATLRNGFTIVESSACVDVKNYDAKIGADICVERIKNQVWNQLGFLLQTAYKGIS